jgi:hypothetical protein
VEVLFGFSVELFGVDVLELFEFGGYKFKLPMGYSIGAETTGAGSVVPWTTGANTIVVELSVLELFDTDSVTNIMVELFGLELLKSAVGAGSTDAGVFCPLSEAGSNTGAIVMELFAVGADALVLVSCAFVPDSGAIVMELVFFPLLIDDNWPWLVTCLWKIG